MEELKPCPFCGCEIIDVIDEYPLNGRVYYWIRCRDCNIRTRPCCENRVEAVQAWNTRVGDKE